MLWLRLSSEHHAWIDFLLAMTEKEIKARYKHALLGFLWIILNPLLQMAVIGCIFQFFVPTQVENYFIFLFAGLLPWNLFAYSVTKNTPIIVNERQLISKSKFPREALVLSVVLSNFFHFLIALFLFFMVALILGQIQLAALLMLPIVLLWIVLLTSGLSLLLSALNVRYRDISFLVQAIIPLWFYATPVLYELTLIPTRFHLLWYLNPMTAIVQLFQNMSTTGSSITAIHLAVSACISIAIICGGWWWFHKESLYFDDWV